MVRTTGGTLITCDAAARELILYWNQSEKFVLKADLGDNVLLVKPEAVELIRKRLQQMNDELNYDPPLGDGPEGE